MQVLNGARHTSTDRHSGDADAGRWHDTPDDATIEHLPCSPAIGIPPPIV